MICMCRPISCSIRTKSSQKHFVKKNRLGYKILHFLFGEVPDLKDIKVFLKYFVIRQRIAKRETKFVFLLSRIGAVMANCI